MKRRHELWVKSRLHALASGDGPTLATVMGSGNHLWPLISRAFGWQLGMPEGLSEDEEDIIDSALQTITDWCEISTDVELQGLRSVREAKRSMTAEIDSLAGAGFLLLAGQRQAAWGGGEVTGPVVVLEVMRPEDLEPLRLSPTEQGASAPETPDGS